MVGLYLTLTCCMHHAATLPSVATPQPLTPDVKHQFSSANGLIQQLSARPTFGDGSDAQSPWLVATFRRWGGPTNRHGPPAATYANSACRRARFASWPAGAPPELTAFPSGSAAAAVPTLITRAAGAENEEQSSAGKLRLVFRGSHGGGDCGAVVSGAAPQ